MAQKGTIDRFEEEWAVVELGNGEFIDIPIETLPSDAVEGSAILMEKGERIVLLKEETDSNRERIQELMDNLFED